MKTKAYLVISVRELRKAIRFAESIRVVTTSTGTKRSLSATCLVMDLEIDSDFQSKTGASQANVIQLR